MRKWSVDTACWTAQQSLVNEYVAFDAEEGVALRTNNTLLFVQSGRVNLLRFVTACTAESAVEAQDLRNCVFSILCHQSDETY